MNKYIIISIIFILIIILSLYQSHTISEGFKSIEGISDCWYINLYRSQDRNKNIQKELLKLSPLEFTRWPGVDGRNLTDEDYDSLNIPFWSRPNFTLESKQKTRKGEIGVYLSHTNLLKHLNTLQVNPDIGHLILEDDIKIDDDFVSFWNRSYKTLPSNWDMVFVGLLGNKIESTNNGIGIPVNITGAHAYVVKHSSIPKILEYTKIMSEPIDEVYSRNSKNLNIYALNPYKIHQNGSESTIVVN